MSERGNQEQQIDKYQRRLNELYRTRKQIVEGIKDVRRKQRITAERTRQGIQTLPSKETLDARPSGEELKSQQSLDHPHLDTQQQEIKKVVQVHSSLRDRNRRLLGGLNKHLQKAESQLSQQSNKTRSKQTIEERVLLKQRQAAQQFQLQKRRQLETELERLALAKENNSKEMLATENIILKNKFIAYVSDLEQYLFTQTTPSLAWKPNYQAAQNDKVSKALQESRENMQLKNAKEVLEQVISYNKVFDFNAYRMENEREFYANYLDNYFASKINFITTTTQPAILWLPNKHNDNTRQQLLASTETSHQLRATVAQQCETFYKRFQKETLNAGEHSQQSESQH